uniref:NADH dehydrogenase [ubiquinone] 1 alpha subcomplex subunit 13 n=1 Tax=Kalmanozyma brasiliensis (strain GHG001) TaxID=1365824 RepID=V5E773_KALBG
MSGAGYQPIRYKRNLPGKNLSGLTIFGSVIAICAYGFYKVGLGNLEQRELKRERAWSRIHLIPVLMAESDRDEYRRNEAQVAREKEIMKDVPGWEAGKSVYNTKRYTPKNFTVL